MRLYINIAPHNFFIKMILLKYHHWIIRSIQTELKISSLPAKNKFAIVCLFLGKSKIYGHYNKIFAIRPLVHVSREKLKNKE